MSCVRMRVAKSDWCASRSVVSVSCSASRERSQRARPSGPSSVRRCLEPAGGSPLGMRGSFERGSGPAGARPNGRLTVRSDSSRRMRVARSPPGAIAVSWGRSSMNVVCRRPARKSGSSSSLPRNAWFVVTPRMRTSSTARRARAIAVCMSMPRVVSFSEQRVEVGGDLRPHVRRALVEAHPGAARRAVGGDRAGVGPEPGAGVLGRDAALQREAALADAVLRQPQLVQPGALGDEQLGAHEVDVRRLLGDRVLDLDPRVHLDEDVLALLVVDEELHGAGVHVAHVRGELHGVRADAVAERRIEVRRRRDLDDLLVAPLDRAVALEEVHEAAAPVGQDLHLDVPRAHHGLLEVDGRVAERALGLASRGPDGLLQIGQVGHESHPAAAAAVRGLRRRPACRAPRRGRRRRRPPPAARSRAGPAGPPRSPPRAPGPCPRRARAPPPAGRRT